MGRGKDTVYNASNAREPTGRRSSADGSDLLQCTHGARPNRGRPSERPGRTPAGAREDGSGRRGGRAGGTERCAGLQERASDPHRAATTGLPLLPSGPDGVSQELAVRDLPFPAAGHTGVVSPGARSTGPPGRGSAHAPGSARLGGCPAGRPGGHPEAPTLSRLVQCTFTTPAAPTQPGRRVRVNG